MPRLPDADPLLTLAIVLVAGVVSGKLAKLVRLPSITGQIIVGVLLGG
jgi:Kef-type K+ transport system membrane component KefB